MATLATVQCNAQPANARTIRDEDYLYVSAALPTTGTK